jgi:hypothetical protein
LIIYLVTPAQAGVQKKRIISILYWIPAFAGMTMRDEVSYKKNV